MGKERERTRDGERNKRGKEGEKKKGWNGGWRVAHNCSTTFDKLPPGSF